MSKAENIIVLKNTLKYRTPTIWLLVSFWTLLSTSAMATTSPSTTAQQACEVGKNTVESVVVVGGTHGNEYTGVWCVKALERQLKAQNGGSTPAYPFALSTLIGNPEAYKANRRFLDADLNRQFSYEALVEEREQRQSTIEGRRAQELDSILGPKFAEADTTKRRTDVIIDLHTTTTNMGTTLIVGAGDPLTTSMAAYIKAKATESTVTILMHTHSSDRERPHVASIGNHAFTIEVGPVAQGLLRHDKVLETQRALDFALEYLKRQSTDPEALQAELKQAYPDGSVPCMRSAPAKRFGEMSSKLVWPSSEDNPNFPALLVHHSVQDKDFSLIHEGDPLFVDLDGKTISYNGSHGSPVRLVFINEGGYYYASSGTGISVAMDDVFELGTGLLKSLSQSKTEKAETITNS